MTDRSSEDVRLSLQVALQPSASGRHLVRHLEPEKPFFYLGDTAWELLHRMNEDEITMYLENRAKKGFNSVMVCLIPEHGGLEMPNRNGDWPFEPSYTFTREAYVLDLSKPNPAYFAFLDKVIVQAADLGIIISLVPTWGRYLNGGFYNGPFLFDEQSAYAYDRFLGHRYPFHPFILGGDSVRYWRPRRYQEEGLTGLYEAEDYGSLTEAMARGLIDGEESAIDSLDQELQEKARGYTTLITFHSCQPWLASAPEATASAQFPEAEWLTYDCVQSGHYDRQWSRATAGSSTDAQVGSTAGPPRRIWQATRPYVPIRMMYNQKAPNGRPRPVIDLEPHYEYDQPIWTAADIRCGAWRSVFAGACGYTYGANSIWQVHNAQSKTHPPIQPPTTAYTDWYLELDLPGAWAVSVLRNVISSLPDSLSRVPDCSFILSDRFDQDEGNEPGTNMISGLRGTTWAMVHLPLGGEVTVNPAQCLDKAYRSWWIDPKDGSKIVIDRGAKSDPTSQREYIAPSYGSLNNDWVLLLERYTA